MGAAVNAETVREMGVRVGGSPVSSTRTELAGVFTALKPGQAVRILIDSEIAMHRLRSLTRDGCRPREYELKDLDILRQAMAEEERAQDDVGKVDEDEDECRQRVTRDAPMP